MHTRDLALYAAIIATLNGGWSLFHAVIRDRARIRVTVREMITAPGPPRDIIDVSVTNRGRRAVYVRTVAWVNPKGGGGHVVSQDILRQLAQPRKLEEGEPFSAMHGLQGGYTKGQLPLKRWFVVDGAGRVHPLRERYRQRLQRLVRRRKK